MRERILSRVLLPAPLRPMTPITWPASTSKLTSRRAQSSLTCPVDEPAWRSRRTGAVAAFVMASRRVPARSRAAPIRYRLPSPEMLIAVLIRRPRRRRSMRLK